MIFTYPYKRRAVSSDHYRCLMFVFRYQRSEIENTQRAK